MNVDPMPISNSPRGGLYTPSGEVRSSNSNNNLAQGSSSNNLGPSQMPSGSAANAPGDKPLSRIASSSSLEDRNNRVSGNNLAVGGSGGANSGNGSAWKATSSRGPPSQSHQYHHGQQAYPYQQGGYPASQPPHRASRGQSDSMSRGELLLCCLCHSKRSCLCFFLLPSLLTPNLNIRANRFRARILPVRTAPRLIRAPARPT